VRLFDEPSPDALALAGLAAGLFDLALIGLVVFAMVDATAPPQDLPWKPLAIDQPLGLATTGKLEGVIGRADRCLAFLSDQDVAFTRAPDRDHGGFCVVKSAVRLGPQGVRLDPPAPLMACPLATAFALWTRQVVQPAARELLGRPVAAIEHYGTYACRRMYGETGAAPSEHATAEAVDVAGFRLADGNLVTVLKDWTDPGRRGRFLHRVRDEGCRLFRVALSPDYNAAHRNHLHFDMSPFRLCR
jgi:hypothetical protein